ncbi:MAG: DUF3105 domain-containing protein [bacterium]
MSRWNRRPRGLTPALLALALAACSEPSALLPVDAGTADAATADAAPVDAAPADAARPDARIPDVDARRPDAAPVDAAPPDAAPPADAAPADATPADASPADAAADAAPIDAAPADAAPPELDAAPLDAAPQDAAPKADAAPPPNHGIDTFDYTCHDPAWRPGACVAGVGEFNDGEGNQQHIADDIEIPPYPLSPPSAGAHRSRWARWGEYVSLPPQRWLHNLEHGGIAFLYHPCTPPEMVQALRDLIHARPEGDGLLYILTPYADMEHAIAVVAWEWRYQADCVRPDEIGLFINRFHGMGPEAVAADGAYSEGFIGR